MNETPRTVVTTGGLIQPGQRYHPTAEAVAAGRQPAGELAIIRLLTGADKGLLEAEERNGAPRLVVLAEWQVEAWVRLGDLELQA